MKSRKRKKRPKTIGKKIKNRQSEREEGREEATKRNLYCLFWESGVGSVAMQATQEQDMKGDIGIRARRGPASIHENVEEDRIRSSG